MASIKKRRKDSEFIEFSSIFRYKNELDNPHAIHIFFVIMFAHFYRALAEVANSFIHFNDKKMIDRWLSPASHISI